MRAICRSLKRKYYLRRYGVGGPVVTCVYPQDFRDQGAKVGAGCRFYSNNFTSESYLIEFGNHVEIAMGVVFVTHDGAVWVFREKEPALELFGRITIGNNVFIGMNSIILLNTSIGDNSIVGAMSLVKGAFPPGSVIAGVPAKKICSVEEYYAKNQDDYSRFRELSGDAKKRAVLKHVSRHVANR